ncbi:MAG: hypothetical protein JEZ08_18990 [Clostridiales bacterium]|nr:hypothetical protein [Clostridiales bacterium]
MEDYHGSDATQSRGTEVVTMKDWIITLLIMFVPIVNIVMPFVWAFGSGTNPSKANFFKAQIILAVIGIILWFLFFGAMFASFMSYMY